ncbi:Outer membrane lipoprotein LptE/RlpB (LPS assembly) [Desulfuromusa kysingii]|uniref:Outer membrane lipoprotein LptE/RlpB (LPS assembly) n=1 Tax=Desulfuromusa kysingii TaxID=37625 RepID=A0A1H4BI32_9BACT|nr:LptE family protein [Desulfuromusa kysingii]SEA47668.1 Outer membrane lipoprotein LptE/RlpB (LPS assembly) [Desulfuromusa kysingii]
MKSAFFLLLFLFLAGCGYHFPGQGGTLPEGVEKVYIQLFTNKTSQPQLDNKLTSRVSEVFSRNNKISQVEHIGQAEAILEGTIRSYSSRALSYDSNDDIGEYRATMVVDVTLKKPNTEAPIWTGTVSWSEEYSSSANKNDEDDLEQNAINEITLRMAEEILYKMLDDF